VPACPIRWPSFGNAVEKRWRDAQRPVDSRTRVALRDAGSRLSRASIRYRSRFAPLRKWSPDRVSGQIDAYEADVERMFGVTLV